MIDERYLIASIEQFVGRELGVSEWIVVTQDMINNLPRRPATDNGFTSTWNERGVKVPLVVRLHTAI